MRKLLPLLVVCLSTAFTAFSQTCPANYTQTKLDWDRMGVLNTLDYSIGSLSTTMITSQNFAFGAIQLNVLHNYPVTANSCPRDVSTHTGHWGSYGWGEDVEFIGNGKITLTFSSAVYNLKFSLQDIEKGQSANITAVNGTTSQPITLTRCATTGSILTISNSGTTTPTVTSQNGNGQTGLADNDKNVGSFNVDIAGPVTKVEINVGTSQTSVNNENDVFLSDITACAPGTFPSNYQQTGSNQPFTGQPDYFITTPDNNSAYMVDPATGRAWHLFTESSATYINSFAYDPYNRILYYVVDASSNPSSNKKIRKYDFNLEAATDFITDVTSYGIPTFSGGVESSGASYYDGALYLGIEGGAQKESMVWRIPINNGVPSQAYQVFGVSTTGHDWGDIVVKNGTFYDFNTSTGGGSQIKHMNLLTNDTLINYPVVNVGQAGMGWNGDLYSVRNVVEKYNENGTKGVGATISVVSGPAWVGNAGDASGPFRPKADFGDAPASFDPNPQSPAVHEINSELKIGATLDREWEKTSSADARADGSDEDGLIVGQIMNLNNGSYLVQVNVYNNTGAPATVAAWADFNKDNVFQPEEGVVASAPVASGTITQKVDLYWSGINHNLASNSNTYLRVRITSAANNMTVNSSTGYFRDGEVEDYYVAVNTTPLAVRGLSLEAIKVHDGVQLDWKVTGDEEDVKGYIVHRSKDGRNWQPLLSLKPSGNLKYSTSDKQPLQGDSYYRVEVVLLNGQSIYTEIRKVTFGVSDFTVSVFANPAVNVAKVRVYAHKEEKAILSFFDNNGNKVFGQSVYINRGHTEIAVPVSHLPAGLYLLNLESESQSEKRKIMIAN